jgi:acyl dehydratase
MSVRKTIDLRMRPDLGHSPWLIITQDMITKLRQVTLDPDDLMHNDPQWAEAEGPFGTIVSYGFLTMSLLTYFSHQLTHHKRLGYALNYGFDRLRIVSPVPVNPRVRANFFLADVIPRDDGRQLIKFNVSIEIEGVDKPALVAEWLAIECPRTAPEAYHAN